MPHRACRSGHGRFVSHLENYRWFCLSLLCCGHTHLTPSPANHRILEAGAFDSGEEDMRLSKQSWTGRLGYIDNGLCHLAEYPSSNVCLHCCHQLSISSLIGAESE